MADPDKDWKPKGRPQSVLAQNFSMALDSIFGLDDGTDELVQSVEQKKRAVSSQSAELEALQARLRATEERLKARQSQSASPSGGNSKQSIPRRRVPVGNPSGSLRTTQPAAPTSPLATQPAANQSRPQTASSASHQPSSNKGNTSKEQLEETQSEEEESS